MSLIPGTDMPKPRIRYVRTEQLWECSGGGYAGRSSGYYGSFWWWLAEVKKAEPWRGTSISLALTALGPKLTVSSDLHAARRS